MKILITGIGITGKSTFRRLLVELLKKWGLSVEHFDADKFEELRAKEEKDCLKDLPAVFQPNTVYIIEDIHAPEENAVLPLAEYDIIFYLKTNFVSQTLFWLTRMWQWFLVGQFSWEPKIGWQGTGKAKDFHNIFPILKNFIRDLWNRKKWVREDLKVIHPFPHQIVKTFWTRKGPKFKLIFYRK